MNRMIFLSAVTLLSSAATATAGPGSAFIEQIGSRTHNMAAEASIRPLSRASAIDIRQMERALLDDLRGRFGEKGGIEIDQKGDRHIATISQDEGVGNIAAIEQRGFDNFVMLTQTGGMNVAAISQWGSGNSTRGVQSGDANYARISQRSDGNTVRFTQSGMGNVLTVVQD